MTMSATDVRVQGNLIITGVLDSQDVTQTNLYVQDKEINLAAASNNQPVYDGVGNDGAGVIIQGIPSTNVDSSQSNLVEKSIRWHQNQAGVLGLGAYDIGVFYSCSGRREGA